MGSIRFAREALTDALLAEFTPLLQQHWREIAHYPDIPLNPDYETYRAAESAGILRVYTVRDGSACVGYALFFVRNNPHYTGSLQAVQDVLYLHPSQRGGNGYRFIAWCDIQLQREGVQAVYHHSKAAHNFGALLNRQGYELVDLIYAKRLDTVAATRGLPSGFDPARWDGEEGG
jgi:hypothetical protein